MVGEVIDLKFSRLSEVVIGFYVEKYEVLV